MREARRTLGCWLLAAFLERGGDPTRAPTRYHVPRPVPLVRPLSGDELRRFAGPLAPVVALAAARAAGEPGREQDRAYGRPNVSPGAIGRLLAFPSA
jgi:hypothetical protein